MYNTEQGARMILLSIVNEFRKKYKRNFHLFPGSYFNYIKKII